MENKLKKHLTWLIHLESSGIPEEDLSDIMLRVIENRKYFQHERMIHLLVTMSIAIILMFVFYMFITRLNNLFGLLFLILLILEGAYLLHYYRIENGVQKLWEIEQNLFKDITSHDGPDQ